MNLTTQTPRQIDTQLADLADKAAAAESRIASALDTIHHMLGERQTYITRTRRTWPTTDADALDAARARGDEYEIRYSRTFAQIVAQHDAAAVDMNTAYAAMEPFNAEFNRRGGWTRFFYVRGGHIHATLSTSCNRQHDTDQGWNPELSGKTEAEAVAELGPNLCTKCFPTAPVAWTMGTPRKTREQIAAEKAAAAEAARKNDPKLIADVDGSPLRVGGDTLRTVRSAEIAAVWHLGWAAHGLYGEPNETYAAEHEANARRIAAALAAKAGTTTDEEMAKATVKAIKKVRKDYGPEHAAKVAARWNG